MLNFPMLAMKYGFVQITNWGVEILEIESRRDSGQGRKKRDTHFGPWFVG